MNAGLLGEHLASPRTAPKTNQSTALDTKTAQRGESSNKDEFASYVTQDSDPARPDPGVSDTSTATAPPPETKPDQAEISISASALSAPEMDAADAVITGNLSPAAADVETPNTNLPPVLDGAQGRPTEADQAAFVQSGEAGEIIAQDPRIRGDIDARNAERAPRGQTVKHVEGAALTTPDPNAAITESGVIEPGIDSVERGRFGHASLDAESRYPAPQVQGLETPTADIEQTSFRQTVNPEISALDRLASGGVARDVPTVIADTAAPVAVTTTASTPSVQPSGLTPTAPAIPLATPTELSNVILNAINNGLDPQEQLVVQLDPPELGRIMIDFKFDAQGLQQIVVTTENPEALKRLREMHFELTQALREHGLSEQNMSFRDQAEGQSQQDSTDSDSPRLMAQLIAAEDRRASPSASPTASSSLSRDRLDLLL